MIELSGPRVRLIVPSAEDVDEVTRICQDPAIQQWTTVPSPYAREDAEKFVCDLVPKGWEEGNRLTWSIRVGQPLRLAGMIDLFHIKDGGGEVGFWMSPEHRGSGLMREAVGVVCDYGFGELGLTRIQWQAYAGNVGSASVARSAGFRYEGLLRMEGVQRGVRHDSWIGSLLATDDRSPVGGWPL